MKTVYFACLFAVLVVCATAKSCRRAEDCGEDECCIDRGIFRRGECKPLATEGKSCNEVDARIHVVSGKYVEYCPCQEGLYCEPEEVDEDESYIKKIFRDYKCTTERRDTVRPTRRPRPTRPTAAPEEEVTEA